MKNKLIVGIVAIVVIAFVILQSGVLSNPFYEEDAEGLGLWGQKIEIIYTDGTSTNFKVENEKPLYVFFENQPVESVKYSLNAKATTDYPELIDSIIVDVSGYNIGFVVYDVSDVYVNAYIHSIATLPEITVPVDSGWHELISVTIPIQDANGIIPIDVVDGDYKLMIEPGSEVVLKYKESVTSDWTNVPSPTTEILIPVTVGPIVSVDFGHGGAT